MVDKIKKYNLRKDSEADQDDLIKTVQKVLYDEEFFLKLASTISTMVCDKLNQRMIQLEENVKAVETLNKKLVSDNAKLCLEVDRLEQYSRRNNLRFFGLPETIGENTDMLILEVIKSKLGLDMSLSDIERSHRVGIPNNDVRNNRPRAILVKFCSYRNRQQLLNRKRFLKNTGFFINEDLTRNRQQLLREVSDKLGRQHVWTADGNIFARIDNKKVKVERVEDIVIAPNT